MAVDLNRLTADEETVRMMRRYEIVGDLLGARAIQNVLDALNYYRCLALHNEQELARATAHRERVIGDLGS